MDGPRLLAFLKIGGSDGRVSIGTPWGYLTHRRFRYAVAMDAPAPVLVSEAPAATLGQRLALAGGWIGVPSGLLLLVDASGLGLDTLGPTDTVVCSGLYILGAVLLLAGAWVGRKALGLNGFAVVLACVLGSVVPIFFCVLVWSLSGRYAAYFHKVYVAQGQAAAIERAELERAAIVSESPANLAPTPEPEGHDGSRLDRLERLAELQRAGSLTPEEFESEKRRLLAG